MANLLDGLILYLDPEAGAKRMKNRLKARAYEAADTGSKWKKWNAPSAGPNDLIGAQGLIARNRARDLIRNNPFSANAIQVLSSSIVGDGIRPTPIEGMTSEVGKKALKLWNEWAGTTECDVSGRSNMYGLQRLAVRAAIEGGQSFIRRRNQPASKKMDIPIKLQVLESEFLDTTKQTIRGKQSGNYIINGIEFNGSGERVAYWMFRNHPDETVQLRSITSVRVPANEVIHIYRESRPGQEIGITWFAPVIRGLRDLDEYMEAQLVKQKISAVFAAFLTSADGESLPKDDDGDISMRAGSIVDLPAGKDVSFTDPPAVDGYPEFIKTNLMGMATGLGITYESLTGDLNNVNFSSARIGANRMKRNIEDWQSNMVIPTMCNKVWHWFVASANIQGANLGELQAKWTRPRFELVDPTKEIPAIRAAVRAGLKSHSEALRELGYDPAVVFNEIAEDNKIIDGLKLVLDSDPRKTSGAGLTQARPDGEGGTTIPNTEVGDKKTAGNETTESEDDG